MTTGVVVMSYGSPTGPGDIARYYTDIRRGRPPSDEQLAELSRRYATIGGLSPLIERTAGQIDAIRRALDEIAPGDHLVLSGTKHASPSIEEAVHLASECGAERIVGIVLAPHYARASVGEYIERAANAARVVGLPARFVERYGSNPALIGLLGDRVVAAVEPFASDIAGTEVLFSAHSLPLRSLRPDDRYADEIAETANLVVARQELRHARTTWQSAGMTEDAWLGPDLLTVLEELASVGKRNVVVCPCGFTSDHLEILYDLDYVASRRCAELGIAFARTASLNDDPVFASMLARLVLAT